MTIKRQGPQSDLKKLLLTDTHFVEGDKTSYWVTVITDNE